MTRSRTARSISARFNTATPSPSPSKCEPRVHRWTGTIAASAVSGHVARDLVVGAIIVASRRVLLGYRHPARRYYPACWDVPGGHVQAGEHSQAALHRELREEIGIEVDLTERVADVRRVGDDYDMQLWIVRSWRGDITNQAPLEHAELRWFALHGLAGLPLADDRYLEVLTHALSTDDRSGGVADEPAIHQPPYGGHVPIQDVAAGDLGAGDVVRLDDPQAHRVERVLRVDARVVLELRAVGLEIAEAVRGTLPEDRLVTRLGTAAD